MLNKKFYRCNHCGNIVGIIESSGVPLVCCGEKMTLLEPNTTDAAQEKHLPVVSVQGNKVSVVVGSVIHPMSEEHQINWIYLETAQGGQRKRLNATDAPKADFLLAEDDRPVAVYVYCNLHGLWATEL